MDIINVIEYAEAQHDVVAEWELLDMGISYESIERAVAAGHLEPVHEGVYQLGDRPLTWLGRCKAATLAEPGSVISHRTAAMIHGMLPIDEDRPIDITVATGRDANRIRRDALNERSSERFRIRQGRPLSTA